MTSGLEMEKVYSQRTSKGEDKEKVKKKE